MCATRRMKADRISSRTKLPACFDDSDVHPTTSICRSSSTDQLEHAQNGVDMPSLVGSEALCCEADLSGHAQLELVIGNFEESKQFADQYPDVLLVDERV